jgi:hypothetical protein
MKNLDRSVLLQALRRLGELAGEEGLILECCIYGGALMMLAYDARANTRDVDAVVRPREPALRLVEKVALEMELPENWMNDQVRTFLAPSEDVRDLPIQVPGLHLTAPTAGYLLAMKALACRTSLPGYKGDVEDLRFLIRKMEIESVDEIQTWIDRYYPDDVIPAPQRETLRLLIEEVGS